MTYTNQEIKQFIEEEDVKFIRLAFCDVFGKQKNISIMPTELDRAFREGIAIDAWAVAGFDGFDRSDLFLHPDPQTLAILPWRPETGRVVRMFCDITWPDGAEDFSRRPQHMLPEKAIIFILAQSRNSISSAMTWRERKPVSPMIRQDIWTLDPRTGERTSGGRSASLWSRWESIRRVPTTKKGRDKMRLISATVKPSHPPMTP